MNAEIIAFNDRTVMANKNGCQVNGLSSSSKHYGRLESAVKAIGWDAAFKLMCEEVYPGLLDKTRSVFGENKVSWKGNGVAGVHSAKTYPRYTGVEAEYVSFSENHLATTGVVSEQRFPGNHAQAVLGMMYFDVLSQGLKDGPFDSEDAFCSFIKARYEQYCSDIEGFEVYEPGNSAEEADSEPLEA